MRHSRRAVMAERYKLYIRKNIFNGRYFVRNLQLGICILVVAGVLAGGIVLVNATEPQSEKKAAEVSVKEALFGNSEENETVLDEQATEEKSEAMETVNGTESVTATEAITEAVFAETKTAAEYIEAANQNAEEQAVKSEFDGKCIANVEETLNIRKDPSTEAEFVGSMNPGAIAIVEGTEGEWTKIKSGDVEGYVLTDYVLTGESAEQLAKDYVTLRGTVLEDGVNIRSEKSTDSEILVVLEKDDTITVLEEEEDTAAKEIEAQAASVEDTAQAPETEDSKETKTEETQESEITWLPVMLEDGQTGYVSSDFINVDRLYAVAVSAEELERQAAEKAAAEQAAAEEAMRLAEAKKKNNSSGGSGNTGSKSSSSNTYQGAVTTPVTAANSGELIGSFTITAYCGCSACCGGHNQTASGTIPTEGRTIAADTSILPFGTQVVIDGIVYTVEDRGSGVVGNHIDIFIATHERALAFGTRTVNVYKY
ncbi:MAG: SH3 domain-containing protein [Bacteroidales bacterium]|nr:SH3 domain-containing protein [Clostridium sp.]MCM1204055.1 SH3 domain-containing protein [Bacteroidales bacterium]